MKKSVIFLAILFGITTVKGQSWDAYYGKLPDGSVVGIDSVQILVIDAETNQTYYMLVSQLTVAHLDAALAALGDTASAIRAVIGTVESITYPDAGISLSTGSAWGTSITNNSANWNTAYGWGDHSTASY